MKKQRNKAYRPKPVYKNVVDWAIAGATKMLAADVVTLMVPMKAAYTKFCTATACQQDWEDLVTQIMISKQLAVMNIANNLADDIDHGLAMLDKVGARMIEQNKSTCYARELAAISWAMEIYKIQLEHCTQAEFSRAHKQVKNILLSGFKTKEKVCDVSAAF
jgi:hypothetical protein